MEIRLPAGMIAAHMGRPRHRVEPVGGMMTRFKQQRGHFRRHHLIEAAGDKEHGSCSLRNVLYWIKLVQRESA